MATWAPADALLLMNVKDLMVLLIFLRDYYPLHPRASPGNQMGSGQHHSPRLCEVAGELLLLSTPPSCFRNSSLGG